MASPVVVTWLLQDLLQADESPAFDPVLTHFHTGACDDLALVREPQASLDCIVGCLRCHSGHGCLHQETVGCDVWS